MITDDFINPEHQGADRELLRTFYEACHADGGTVDESTLRGIHAVLALAPESIRQRQRRCALDALRGPRYLRQQGGEWQGADHPDGHWRPISAPQPGLLWPADPPAAGQRQALSPTAQSVLDAANGASSYGPNDCLSDACEIATAVVRALADQVVPAASSLDRARWSPFAGQIRSEILAIAAELEGADG